MAQEKLIRLISLKKWFYFSKLENKRLINNFAYQTMKILNFKQNKYVYIYI